jgi:hypothetical protein
MRTGLSIALGSCLRRKTATLLRGHLRCRIGQRILQFQRIR